MRGKGIKRRWSLEEETLLKEVWNNMLKEDILKLLNRSWDAIKVRASKLKLSRREFIGKELSKRFSKKRKVKCEICGKEILRKPKDILPHVFCSRKCHGKWVSMHPPSRGIHRSKEYREKLSCIRKERGLSKGKNNPMWGKTHSPEAKQKIREARMKQTIPRRPTTPELKFASICRKHNLPFRYVGNEKVWIAGKNPDFIHRALPIVVEILGRYWHKDEDEQKLKEHYFAHGFSCITFWDSELKEDVVLGKLQV